MADTTDNNPYEAWIPHASVEDRQKAEADYAKVQSSIGILSDFFADLDADIEALHGTEIIDGVNPATNPEHVLKAVLVNQQTRHKLIVLHNKYRVNYGKYLDGADAA